MKAWQGPWVSVRPQLALAAHCPASLAEMGASGSVSDPVSNNKAERVTKETPGFHLQFPCVYRCVYNKHLPTQRDSEICHCVQRTPVNHYIRHKQGWIETIMRRKFLRSFWSTAHWPVKFCLSSLLQNSKEPVDVSYPVCSSRGSNRGRENRRSKTVP